VRVRQQPLDRLVAGVSIYPLDDDALSLAKIEARSVTENERVELDLGPAEKPVSAANAPCRSVCPRLLCLRSG